MNEPPPEMNLTQQVPLANLKVGETYISHNIRAHPVGRRYQQFTVKRLLPQHGRTRWIQSVNSRIFNTASHQHNYNHGGPLRFYKLNPRPLGRNAMGLQLATPAEGANATSQALGIPNIQSRIGSFLTGKKGTLNAQQKQLHEEATRPPGGAGAGSRRRRNRRQTRRRR